MEGLFRMPQAPNKKKKILVVDDEPDIVTLIKSRLEANGYDVVSAYNGKDGLEKAIEAQPDMILLDLMMPIMDGYEAGQKLKENPKTKNIPIILFTAASAEEVAKKGAETIEAIDYVVKPFDDAALLFLINRIADITEKAKS